MEVDNPELENFLHNWKDEINRSKQPRYREVSEASSSTMRPMSREVSEASSATMRPMSSTPERSWPQNYFDSYLPEEDRMDIEPQEEDYLPGIDPNLMPFVIATDFGTTFSSVAFTRRYQGTWEPPQSISNYPHDPFKLNGGEAYEVPTQSCYPNIATLRNHGDEERDLPETGEKIKNIFDDDDEMEDPLSHLRNEDSSDDREGSVSDEDQEMFNRETEDALSDQESLPFYHWGYGIQALMRSDTSRFSQFRHLERFKLMLDETPKTQIIREKLRPTLIQLKRWGMIKEDHDVIADYLTQLFLHTKDQLKNGNSEFTDACPVEHVLCVPNAWSSKACRVMQKAMETAIRRSRLGSLDNLFIISEPEAAATFVLYENSKINVHTDETFIIIDAGGGTVDITTYTVLKNYPLRLREALEPKGDLCGSSYLNENFQKHLLERLSSEDNLKDNLKDKGMTIEEVVDEAMIEFEFIWKRTVDLAASRDPNYKVPTWVVKVPGLKENRRERFIENGVLVEHNDIHDIFLQPLKDIWKLLKEQVDLAQNKNLHVQKVILVGGFAGSPSLRGYLKGKLKMLSAQYRSSIELVAPQLSYDTAVSLGAIRRALQKEDGPQRVTKSSFGFLWTDLYDKENIPAHVGIRPNKIDPLDGRKYVKNTINWLVKGGDTLPARAEYGLEVEHTFGKGRKKFLCEEILYVSDQRGESHYRRNHPKNSEAEEAGRIVADMSFLLTENLIELSEPEEGYKGKPHYKVRFELVMIVEGRNLRFEARYPVGGEVIEGKRFCIAAAFEPGTN